jgi:hypothetical protein
MCSHDALGSKELTETARSAHACSPLTNCNYRRDLALSLDGVGRKMTDDPASHVRSRATRMCVQAARRGTQAHRKSQIPSPKSQIQIKKSQRRLSRGVAETRRKFLGLGTWGLGFGIWDLGFSEATGRAAATNRAPRGSPDMRQRRVASTRANGPSDAGASAREPGRNRVPMAASAPVASSGRCGRHARRSPTASVDSGR